MFGKRKNEGRGVGEALSALVHPSESVNVLKMLDQREEAVAAGNWGFAAVIPEAEVEARFEWDDMRHVQRIDDVIQVDSFSGRIFWLRTSYGDLDEEFKYWLRLNSVMNSDDDGDNDNDGPAVPEESISERLGGNWAWFHEKAWTTPRQTP
jgi:hypothetical protein